MTPAAARTARRSSDPSPDAPALRPTRPAPPTARPDAAKRRPPLTVLPKGYRSPRAQQRRRRLIVALSLLGALAGVFGLVLVHVELSAHQLQLVHLQQQADSQQERYMKLRLEVAQLQSPDRIVATAQQLGMVPPTTITYLTASAAGGPGADPAPSASASPGLGWAQTKRNDTGR